MNFVSLLFAMAAGLVFIIDFVWGWRGQNPRSLISLGLALLTVAWMAQLLIETNAADLIHT